MKIIVTLITLLFSFEVFAQCANAPSFSGLSTQDATCFGPTNGSITVSATGGTGNYTFTLTRPDNTSSTQTVAGSGSVTFSDLRGGSYSIALIDDAGCPTGGVVTTTQVQPLVATGTTNGAPDIRINTNPQISPSGTTFAYAPTAKTFTYSIGNNSTTNVAAEGVIFTITRPLSQFTIELASNSTASWEQLPSSPDQQYVEFRLRSGVQILCSQSASISVIITRNNIVAASVPITADVRLETGPQDLMELNNRRAAVFSMQ